MYVSKYRAAVRPIRLAVALLALTVAMPVYAGQSCDLIDGNVGVEDSGGSMADAINAFACGLSNEAIAPNATAVGIVNLAIGVDSTALGIFNTASGEGSTALGARNFVAGSFSTAVGYDNEAEGARSVAIGHQSKALVDGSVALGSGSLADRANTVSVGAAGAERQITNVAAATQATDAVNLAQMSAGDAQTLSAANAYTDSRFFRTDARIDRVGAMGGALAGMAMNSTNLSGRNRVAIGVGSQGGRQAVAVGYQRALMDTRASISLGAAFSGSENTVSGGAGYSW